MENNEWKWVYVSLIAGVLFILLMCVASGTMDGMSGGYAVTFIAFFLTITSFVVALLFFTRARAMDEILGGKKMLAHWVYSMDETQKSAEREFADYRETNRGLLFMVGGFFVIAMVLMLIFGGEGGMLTAGVLFVVLIIIVVVSWAAPKLELKRALKAPREAYIAENGIIYEGAVYPFHSFMMRMDGVGFIKGTDKAPAILGFSFMQLVGLFILRPFEISIPVPAGEEKKAQEIVKKLGRSDGEEEIIGAEPDRCKACGAILSPGQGFCESCGEEATVIELESPDLTPHCPSCGVPVKHGVKFCGSCGKKIE